MKNKRILITGAAGSIGSELARQLCKQNRVYALDINEMGLHELKLELGIPVRVGDIRNRETLRNDVCYNNANVKLIGVRGSVHYKFLGFSHNISEDEDIKILSHLPNLDLYIPETPEKVTEAINDVYSKLNPCYIRL